MNVLRLLGAGLLCAGVAACSSSSSPVSPSSDVRLASGASSSEAKPGSAAAAKPGSATIVDLVLAPDGEFDVLQAAVVRAELVEALSGPRQLTVFAPTDDAFVRSLNVANEAAAIAAVNGLPIDKLTEILLYHVIPGRRTSTPVLAAPVYETLNGQKLTRDTLLAAGILIPDISASNGVVHAIGGVLMPN